MMIAVSHLGGILAFCCWPAKFVRRCSCMISVTISLLLQTAEVCYERVKNWSKATKVNIFSFDYVIVPIYVRPHWSLAVVAHPGNLHPLKMQDPAAPNPSILHLDSLSRRGHDTAEIARNLREWMRMEWRELEKHGDAIPAPVRGRDADDGSADVSNADDSTSDKQKCLILLDAQDGLRHAVKTCRVKTVPKQSNNCDCGLYLLAYAHFFSYRTPQQIVVTANGGVDTSYAADAIAFPRFLQEGWFPMRSGLQLRHSIMRELLELMLAGQADEEPVVSRARKIQEKCTQRYVQC